ncbi:MAG TPA: DUF3667 domain-containing protein [Casimicrobiaceae bacterium]|jgi:hypothetical protein|nr:DUF3667 domain-containing protein [Casimicrobiaceae bacterium]
MTAPLAVEPVTASGETTGTAAAQRCRNCGAIAAGNFCPNCGQETTLALPSAARFLREAAGRYIAFDGRFWRTMHRLVFRPGVLTVDYLAGRRRRYVRPGRLFVGLSIVMFAVLRLAVTTPEIVARDSAAAAKPGTRAVVEGDVDILGAVPPAAVLAPIRSRLEAFDRLTSQQKIEQVTTGMLRYGPWAAIGLLPVFALLLRIAYAGRITRHPRRPRLYAAHLVFGAHNHAFLFVAATLLVVIPSTAVRATLGVWMTIYALASMKTVYGGGWVGIVLRALLIAVVYLTFFAVALLGLVVAAVTLR